MGSLHKNIQLMEFFKAPFLALFLLYINGLPDLVICNIAIYAVDTTLYSKCDQQPEFAFEHESILQDTGLGQAVAC